MTRLTGKSLTYRFWYYVESIKLAVNKRRTKDKQCSATLGGHQCVLIVGHDGMHEGGRFGDDSVGG